MTLPVPLVATATVRITKAASHCCGSKLAEGGTPAAGFSCTGCGQPCTRILGEPMEVTASGGRPANG